MANINKKLKKNLKEIIEVLQPGNMYSDNHFFKMHNMCKRLGVEGAAMQLLGTMPQTKKSYEIEAFLDFGDHPPAYSGWDMMGGSDPDRYVINGRKVDKTASGKPVIEKDTINRDNYPIRRFSCKRGNIIMHVYTSR